MTRLRAIELLERISNANTAGTPLEGRDMLEAAYALAYAVIVLREHTRDADFDRIVAEMAPWLM